MSHEQRIEALESQVEQLQRRIDALEGEGGRESDPDWLAKFDPQYERPVVRALGPGESGDVTRLQDLVRTHTSISDEQTAKRRAKALMGYPEFAVPDYGKWRFDP